MTRKRVREYRETGIRTLGRVAEMPNCRLTKDARVWSEGQVNGLENKFLDGPGGRCYTHMPPPE
jgi:hypothetical protein